MTTTNSSDELTEAFATLNGSGAHSCECPRSVDGGCKCALKDEYLDEVRAARDAKFILKSDVEAAIKSIKCHHDERRGLLISSPPQCLCEYCGTSWEYGTPAPNCKAFGENTELFKALALNPTVEDGEAKL